MTDTEGKLLFTDFEVHFTYGFVLQNGRTPSNVIELINNRKEQWPPELKKDEPPGGWAILYRLRGIEDHRLLHLSISPEKTFEVMPKPAMQTNYTARVLLRSDGAGAVTLSFTVSPRDNDQYYYLGDLEHVMNLIPREYPQTQRLKKLRPKVSMPVGLSKEQKNLFKKSSSAFQLFMQCISQVVKAGGLHWCEVVGSSDCDNTLPAIYNGREEDPQIPYMYVRARAPKDWYQQIFQVGTHPDEQRQARAKLSRELTAILLRFSVTENAPFIAEEYISQHFPISEGALSTRHVNSEFFVAFSNIAAVSLQSDTERDKIPATNSRQAILRSLELSKMRWHYAIYLNRLLDELARSVVAPGFAEQLFVRLEQLSHVRQRAASNLEDPSIYMYDDHIGSEVANHLRHCYIDDLEASTLRKLEMMDKLYNDQVQLARVRDYKKLLSGIPESEYLKRKELKS